MIIRQLDRKRTPFFKLVFLTLIVTVGLNVASGFFIPIQADENWKYVTKLYDPSGKNLCYIGEPQGWSITVPCSKPSSSSNTSITQNSQYATTPGSTVIFTPPVQSTTISITSSSSHTVSGALETFAAKVSPTPNSGTVQFYIDGITAGNSNEIFDGQSTFSKSLPMGTHQISASYLGAPNFNASTSDPIAVTVLSTSNLQGANLTGADLHGINLSDANLQNTNLLNANLQGANLTGANLKGAYIGGTNFVGAITNGCQGCP